MVTVQISYKSGSSATELFGEEHCVSRRVMMASSWEIEHGSTM